MEDFQDTIKDTIIKYKEIIFALDGPICIKCLDELRKQQVIDDNVYTKNRMDDAAREAALV